MVKRNKQFCPLCGRQYEFWDEDINCEYNCGECGKLICIDGKHNYLFCSVKCSDASEFNMIPDESLGR